MLVPVSARLVASRLRVSWLIEQATAAGLFQAAALGRMLILNRAIETAIEFPHVQVYVSPVVASSEFADWNRA